MIQSDGAVLRTMVAGRLAEGRAGVLRDVGRGPETCWEHAISASGDDLPTRQTGERGPRLE